MKMKVITVIFVLFSTVSFAQSETKQHSTINLKQDSENTIYKLYPTQNYSILIKLDTRNGKMWQVYFTVKEGARGHLSLNPISLVSEEKEINGRFTLYPTENIYSFLLLDQIDGDIYRVEWSLELEKRMIVPIN